MSCNGSRLTRAAKLEDGAPQTAFCHPAFPPPFVGHDTPGDLLRSEATEDRRRRLRSCASTAVLTYTLRPLPACQIAGSNISRGY